jgi:hypothetical protein
VTAEGPEVRRLQVEAAVSGKGACQSAAPIAEHCQCHPFSRLVSHQPLQERPTPQPAAADSDMDDAAAEPVCWAVRPTAACIAEQADSPQLRADESAMTARRSCSCWSPRSREESQKWFFRVHQRPSLPWDHDCRRLGSCRVTVLPMRAILRRASRCHRPLKKPDSEKK